MVNTRETDNPENTASSAETALLARRRKWKTAVILAAAAAAIVFGIGRVRLFTVRKEAGEFARNAERTMEFSMKYPVGETIDSKEEFVKELWGLAAFEVETRNGLNTAFDYTEKQYSEKGSKKVHGFERKEDLLAFAMEETWRKCRDELCKEVEADIDLIFQRADHTEGGRKSLAGSNSAALYGIEKQDVLYCYRRGHFTRLSRVMAFVESGDGLEAYKEAADLKENWKALPMDMAYTLKPEMMKAAADEVLLEASKSGNLNDLQKRITQAEMFEKRYHVRLENMKRAQTKRDRLEYEKKPDIPAVGMSTSDARDTKLGPPTRTTKDTGTWEQKNHTFGNMYWEEDGRRLFTASYYDGKIKQVWDTRNVYPSSWNAGRPSGSFSSRDYDIDAYYDDNRDEYDDYDEAYDAFWDDEGAWDDY